jgi:hypothetical protein
MYKGIFASTLHASFSVALSGLCLTGGLTWYTYICMYKGLDTVQYRFQYVYFNIHTNKVFIIFFIFIYEIRRHCNNVYSVNIRLMKKDNKQFNFQDKSKKE